MIADESRRYALPVAIKHFYKNEANLEALCYTEMKGKTLLDEIGILST